MYKDNININNVKIYKIFTRMFSQIWSNKSNNKNKFINISLRLVYNKCDESLFDEQKNFF